MRRLAWVLGESAGSDDVHRRSLAAELGPAGWQFVDRADEADALLVWARGGLSGVEDDLLALGRPLVLMGPTVTADNPVLREASGLVPRGWTPAHPARLRPEGAEAWRQRVAPLGVDIELTSPVLLADKVRDSVSVWVSAPVGLSREPMVTFRSETGVVVFAPHSTTGPTPGAARELARLLHLTLRRALAVDDDAAGPPLTVGLLGYGAIGAEHARAAEQLPGLDLGVVCDRNDERLDSVRATSPEARTTSDANVLIDSDVDVIVVSTPPDTHAEWAMQALRAGKHVVVEKPMSITTEEADAVLAAAASSGTRVVTYQNRRFDPDFVAVRREVESGALGEVFHTETFIGGYGHPCNYWHSDAEVSGGAIYDWGSHIIDQLLTLYPQPIRHVTCLEHKRRWHDVTNADHSNVMIRFEDGSEASFVHSDLAAALKPRWYLLGTDGALVGEWRSTSVIARNEIGTLAEDRLAVTDAPPDLYFMASDGSRTSLTLPDVPSHPFHRELVDDLRHGWPMTVTARQSRRVVAVMEAARESAQAHGDPVTVNGEV